MSQTPETQAFIGILRAREEQNLEDIKLGLLATLDEYQGFTNVKKLFEQAIQAVTLPCSR